MNDNNGILGTLLYNQRLNKSQKKRVYNLFRYNTTSFSVFLDREGDYGDTDKWKTMFPLDDEDFWNDVLVNYNQSTTGYCTTANILLDRLWEGYPFDVVTDDKWVDVMIDIFTQNIDSYEYDAEGFYEMLTRWYNEGKILTDLSTSVWLRIITAFHGYHDKYIGEIIYYILHDEFDESEREQINERLDYEGEIYDEEADKYVSTDEYTDFKEMVDKQYRSLKSWIDNNT